MNSTLPLRFLTRLRKGAGHYNIFYVPRYVKEFYGLRTGSYKGGVTLKDGTTAGYRISLSLHRNTFRGRVPESAGFPGSIVEVWMYPHTWMPSIKIPIQSPVLRFEGPIPSFAYPDTFRTNYRQR